MRTDSNNSDQNEKEIERKETEKNPLNLKHRLICTLQIATVLYLLFAIVDDILIRTTSIHCYLTVSATYTEVVFASLCTVAVLGSAIQSIVIGSFNSKIYGLTLKELLAGPQKRIDIIKTLILSFFSIGVGLLLLALDFCTTITALTTYVLLIIAKSSIEI